MRDFADDLPDASADLMGLWLSLDNEVPRDAVEWCFYSLKAAENVGDLKRIGHFIAGLVEAKRIGRPDIILLRQYYAEFQRAFNSSENELHRLTGIGSRGKLTMQQIVDFLWQANSRLRGKEYNFVKSMWMRGVSSALPAQKKGWLLSIRARVLDELAEEMGSLVEKEA